MSFLPKTLWLASVTSRLKAKLLTTSYKSLHGLAPFPHSAPPASTLPPAPGLPSSTLLPDSVLSHVLFPWGWGQ